MKISLDINTLEIKIEPTDICTKSEESLVITGEIDLTYIDVIGINTLLSQIDPEHIRNYILRKTMRDT